MAKRQLMFAIRKGSNMVFIDNESNEGSVELYYAYDGRFHDGYCPFVMILDGDKTKRVYGFMDKNSKPTMFPFIYSIKEFSDGMARINYARESIDKNGYGYLDTNLQVAIPASFRQAGEFKEGLAIASVDGKSYGVIDKTGKWVVKPKFLWISEFSEGLAYAEQGVRVGYINTKGEWVIKPAYIIAKPFTCGVGRVMKDTGIWTLIDKEGNQIGDKMFTQIGDFNDGVAPATAGDKWGYIDTKGEWVLEPKYHRAHKFSEGRAVVEDFIPTLPHMQAGMMVAMGVIDRDFNVIVEPKHREIGSFIDGYAHVATFEKWGIHTNYMDREGNLFIEE